MKIRHLAQIVKAVALSRVGVSTPLRVAHTLTFRCNLRCHYCGWWKRNDKEMSTEQVESAMRQFAAMGAIAWGFSGGEPLIREDIDDLIRYSKQLGFVTNLTTNGFFVEPHLEALRQLDLLTVSLDGPQYVHDKIRGAGAYAKAMAAIQSAQRHGINVSALTVLSNQNLENDCRGIREMLDVFRSIRCKFVVQPLYTDVFNAEILNEQQIFIKYEKEYQQALDLIQQFGQETRLSLLADSEIDWFRKYYKANATWKCYAGRLYCVLMPDGCVLPCNILQEHGQNGLAIGFKQAFRQLVKPVKSCKCSLVCYTKYNHLFGLKLDAIVNQLRQV